MGKTANPFRETIAWEGAWASEHRQIPSARHRLSQASFANPFGFQTDKDDVRANSRDYHVPRKPRSANRNPTLYPSPKCRSACAISGSEDPPGGGAGGHRSSGNSRPLRAAKRQNPQPDPEPRDAGTKAYSVTSSILKIRLTARLASAVILGVPFSHQLLKHAASNGAALLSLTWVLARAIPQACRSRSHPPNLSPRMDGRNTQGHLRQNRSSCRTMASLPYGSGHSRPQFNSARRSFFFLERPAAMTLMPSHSMRWSASRTVAAGVDAYRAGTPAPYFHACSDLLGKSPDHLHEIRPDVHHLRATTPGPGYLLAIINGQRHAAVIGLPSLASRRKPSGRIGGWRPRCALADQRRQDQSQPTATPVYRRNWRSAAKPGLAGTGY